MRWALFGLLLAAPVFAQGNACQQKCMSRDCTSGCSDDRCMKRCNSQIQSCVVACEKSMSKDELGKHQTYKGNCPGPRGQMVPCDQSSNMPSDEALRERAAKGRPKKAGNPNDNFPHQMPTADNYKEMYEKNKRDKGQ